MQSKNLGYHIEYEEKRLKRLVLEMMMLTSEQLKQAKEAFLSCNIEIAEEVIHNEEKVNSYELSIDRDCKDVLAVQTPVASDLRFILAVYKINMELERIGDIAASIAKFALEMEAPIKQDRFEVANFEKMFDAAIEIYDAVITAFENENTELARRIFKKDKTLNKINKNAAENISEIIKNKPSVIKNALYVFSAIKKLERVGDLCKNISEELIYVHEAKIIKHQKKKWKIQ